MRQSQLFTKTQKEISAQESSPGAQYLLRGGFIDKLSAGVYTLLPLAGLAAFMTLAPRLDGSALLFWGAAVVTVWLLPNLVPALVADAGRLARTFGWKPRFADLREIVSTAWEFEKKR